MTPQEKAQAGLCLLKQAVLDYLGGLPNGATPAEIRRDLDIDDAGPEGQYKGMLLWGVQHRLAEERLIETDRSVFPARVRLRHPVPAPGGEENSDG
jgi:hypothetical protein